jgi:hypothetical protein
MEAGLCNIDHRGCDNPALFGNILTFSQSARPGLEFLRWHVGDAERGDLLAFTQPGVCGGLSPVRDGAVRQVPSGCQTRSRQRAFGSSAPDRPTAGQSWGIGAPVRNRPSSDQGPQRSAERDDPQGPRHQAETNRKTVVEAPHHVPLPSRITPPQRNHRPQPSSTDFCNKIGTKRTSRHVRCSVAIGGKADIEQAALRTRFMSTRPTPRGQIRRTACAPLHSRPHGRLARSRMCQGE